MLFVVNPYATEPEYLDPEDAYIEFKRREYIAALEERQRRVQFERELEREEQRHRLALASIARQEAERRRREQQYQIQRQRELQQLQQLAAHEQAQRRQQLQPEQRPSREEILHRRRAFQEEEERRSRELHKQILSRIFGVPFDDDGNEVNQAESTSRPPLSTEPTGAKKQTVGAAPAKAPETSQAPKPVEISPPTEVAPESPVDADVDAHWSNAPERARALAEITSLGRTFAALKNTFVFPQGPLERLAGSDTPRLAYNSTNATIHAYEHALSELLSKLDTIESHGFKGVREARKQLVTNIEQELSLLEEKVAQRLTSLDIPATPQEISIPIEDASAQDAAPTKTEEVPTQDVVQDSTSRDVVAQEDPPEDPAASKEASVPIEGGSNPNESANPQDATTQDETPQPSTTQEFSSAVVEQVQNLVTEQEPTTSASEPAGESSKNVDATEEAPKDQAISDTRPNPEVSTSEDDPDVTRNPEGELTVTERVPPATPAEKVADDGEDSEVEDAVQVMLEPQRTAVPAGEEHEYELV